MLHFKNKELDKSPKILNFKNKLELTAYSKRASHPNPSSSSNCVKH